MAQGQRRIHGRSSTSRYTATLKSNLPAELKVGLEPLSPIDDPSDREIWRKLGFLFWHYGIPPTGPDRYLDLSIALAKELYPGFRDKPRRRPKKWTLIALWMLAGEMRRELDNGFNQAKAAERLEARDPWKSFMSTGKRRDADDGRKPGAALLDQYTHMPSRYRSIGQKAYGYHVLKDTLEDWDVQVRECLLPLENWKRVARKRGI